MRTGFSVHYTRPKHNQSKLNFSIISRWWHKIFFGFLLHMLETFKNMKNALIHKCIYQYDVCETANKTMFFSTEMILL